MKYTIFKKRLSLMLVTVLAINSICFVNNIFALKKVKKYETVYANLKSDGKERETVVSNWIKDSKFEEKILDKTTVKDINNVNSDKKPENSGDEILWNTSGKDVIYQGRIQKSLPIKTHIKYYLNEQELKADEIAGKSGKIKINIRFENDTKRLVNINGKMKTIYNPFTVATVITFDNEKFSNIQAENSKIYSDGNNQILMFIAFPGLKESLDLDNSSIQELNNLNLPNEITITADTQNFELASIAMVATPKLPDAIRNIKDENKDLDKLQKDLDTTIKAKNTIKKIDPKDSIKNLIKDKSKTQDVKLLVDDLFKYYELDKELIDILLQYITDENISLFDKTKSDLRKVDVNYILDKPILRGITDRLDDEHINKSRVLVEDYDELKTLDMDKFDKALEIINSYDDLKSSIETSHKLYNKMKEHEKELDTLDRAVKYTNRVFDLMDKVNDISFGTSLDDSDIQVMLEALTNKKIKEYNTALTTLFPEKDTDSLSKEQQTKLVYLINTGMKNGQISTTTAEQLITLVNMGKVSEPYKSKIISMFSTKVQNEVINQINTTTSDVREILNEIKILQYDIQRDVGYSYKAQLREALEFVEDIMPQIRYLRKQKKSHEEIFDKAINLANNEEDMRYYKYWANRAKQMKEDMQDNEENINVLKDLLQEYDDPKVNYFYSQIPLLREDFDKVRPILNNLSKEFDIQKNNVSLHESPKTVKTLSDMKKHLDDKKYISDALKLSLNDEIIDVARQMIEIIDEMDSKNKLEDYDNKIKDFRNLIKTKDKLVNLSNNYNTFSGKDDNMESEVSFIMKTDEITAPKQEEKVIDEQEEKKGFFEWIKNLF